tara:strand:+ start:353 stop:667 length:315 start_codon:yes stop_codon:yes gene_type:complete
MDTKTKEPLWNLGYACNEIKDPPSNRDECAALLVEEIKSLLLDVIHEDRNTYDDEWRQVVNFEKDQMTIFVREATKSAYPNTLRLHNASFYRLVGTNLRVELLA